jgi:hypothetical protein
MFKINWIYVKVKLTICLTDHYTMKTWGVVV